MSEEYTHFLIPLFADERLTKLDIEIYWRINSCKRGYCKNQSILRYWTGKGKSSVSRSINRLIECGYLEKTANGYAIPQDEILPENESGGVPSEQLGVPSEQLSDERVPSEQLKVPVEQQKVAAGELSHLSSINNINNKERAHPLEIHFQELSEVITTDTRYVSLQRRPLKKYPDLWMSIPELEEVLAKYKDLKPEHRIECFKRAERKYREAVQTRKQPAVHVSAADWLVSFIYKDMLEELRQLNYHQKSTGDTGRPKPKDFVPAWKKGGEAA